MRIHRHLPHDIDMCMRMQVDELHVTLSRVIC